MDKGYIYKIVSPTGKIYIGQTVDLSRRKSRYRNGYCETQTKLRNSILKYGWLNHTFEIIEEVTADNLKDVLNEKEIAWIEHFQSFKNGLNGTPGGSFSSGRKGKVNSPEHRKKISERFKGKPLTEEHKAKIRNAALGNKRGEGYKHTEEQKMKISAAGMGRTPWNKGLKFLTEGYPQKQIIQNLN